MTDEEKKAYKRGVINGMKFAREMTDLKLSQIGQYCGTERYHVIRPFKTVATDGIAYVMENGHSWLITDAVAVAETLLKKHEFLVIKWDHVTRTLTIGDGNGKALYTQVYEWSDSECNIDAYVTNGVILLTGEY